MEWIRLEKRMPKDSEYNKYGHILVLFIDGSLDVFSHSSFEDRYRQPTHFLPNYFLPEPPKE